MRPSISIRGSVRPSVRQSVGPLVRLSVTLSSRIRENAWFRLLRWGDCKGKWWEVMKGAGKGVTKEGQRRTGRVQICRGTHLTAVYPALFHHHFLLALPFSDLFFISSLFNFFPRFKFSFLASWKFWHWIHHLRSSFARFYPPFARSYPPFPRLCAFFLSLNWSLHPSYLVSAFSLHVSCNVCPKKIELIVS